MAGMAAKMILGDKVKSVTGECLSTCKLHLTGGLPGIVCHLYVCMHDVPVYLYYYTLSQKWWWLSSIMEYAIYWR